MRKTEVSVPSALAWETPCTGCFPDCVTSPRRMSLEGSYCSCPLSCGPLGFLTTWTSAAHTGFLLALGNDIPAGCQRRHSIALELPFFGRVSHAGERACHPRAKGAVSLDACALCRASGLVLFADGQHLSTDYSLEIEKPGFLSAHRGPCLLGPAAELLPQEQSAPSSHVEPLQCRVAWGSVSPPLFLLSSPSGCRSRLGGQASAGTAGASAVSEGRGSALPACGL